MDSANSSVADFRNSDFSPRDPGRIQIVRDAFIERELRPTYDELAAEFKVPRGTIANYAANESWPAMRSAYLDKKLEEADAKSVMLAVVRGDHVVTRKYLNLAIVSLDKITIQVERLDDTKAPSTNAQTINTCMFAAANLAKALHEVGIVGVAKTLDQLGKEDNGRWNPQFAHQLNVTVQNIVEKAKESGVAIPVDMQSPGPPAEKTDTLPTT